MSTAHRPVLFLTLAQLNPTVGDVEGNARRIVVTAQQADRDLRSAGTAASDASHMVVFPELSLTGYYPGDLLETSSFLGRVRAGLQSVLEATESLPHTSWVLGAPIHHEGPGKGLYNGLLVLRGGKVVLQYAKQLLPTYNVFDEGRHFDSGPDVARVLAVGGVRVGFMICEDGWNDEETEYSVNPFQRLRDAAPDLVVSINASPSYVGVREKRHKIYCAASKRHGLPLLYVNQIGGQDTLVYDGASFAVEPESGVVFEASRFAEDVQTLAFLPSAESGQHGRFRSHLLSECAPVAAKGLDTCAFYQAQVSLGLRDYARRCGFCRVLVGSSGGIDSALTLALAAHALGADNVAAVTMPSSYSSSGSVEDSVALCENLGVSLEVHPIAALVQQYASQFEASFGRSLAGVPLENLQARIRGTVLMEYSNAFGHLLLTTGNKSEVSVGYSTLYGDTNGGLGIIGDLYKTEVYALAHHVNEQAGFDLIPQPILTKEPSAELAPDQKDTDSLPAYEVLDAVLKLHIEGKQLAAWENAQARRTVDDLERTEEGAALVRKVHQMVARNEYKRRQAPPVLRLRPRAFGVGRQMPIAAKLLSDQKVPVHV